MSSVAEILNNFPEFKEKQDYVEPTFNEVNDSQEEKLIVSEQEYKQELQKEDEDVKYYFPSKQELDEHIAKNIQEENEKEKIQNQTMGDTCRNCIKSVNTTGNPRAILLYCKWHGVLVNKFQAICGHFQLASNRNPENDAWS